MIKRIARYIAYKKKVKFLRMYVVNELTNIAINKSAYINGLQKILLTASETTDPDVLKQMLSAIDKLSKGTNKGKE